MSSFNTNCEFLNTHRNVLQLYSSTLCSSDVKFKIDIVGIKCSSKHAFKNENEQKNCDKNNTF